jgi:hypothetical protein
VLHHDIQHGDQRRILAHLRLVEGMRGMRRRVYFDYKLYAVKYSVNKSLVSSHYRFDVVEGPYFEFDDRLQCIGSTVHSEYSAYSECIVSA